MKPRVTHSNEPGSLVLSLEEVDGFLLVVNFEEFERHPHGTAGGARLVVVEFGAQPRHLRGVGGGGVVVDEGKER